MGVISKDHFDVFKTSPVTDTSINSTIGTDITVVMGVECRKNYILCLKPFLCV